MITMPEKKQTGTLINILDLETAEGVKGISFDPEVLYTFTVTERTTRKLDKDDGSGHKKEFVVVDLQCTEKESSATIRQSFFYNKKVIINEEDKLKESDVVKFARGIGYPVGIGKPFKFADVLREGITFTAHTKLQMGKDGKTPSGYSEIDLMTVKAVGGSAAPKQSTISGSETDVKFLQDIALGYASKEALIPALSKMGKSGLINLLIDLIDQGKIKFMS
jgi:hypothetical protein